GTFQSPTSIAVGKRTHELKLADVNGDGLRDLVVSTYYGSGISVFLSNGNGTFKTAIEAYAAGPYSFSIGDFSGDGKPDIAVPGNFSSSGARILLGNGNGSFQGVTSIQDVLEYPRAVGIADFNSDGKPDVVISSASYPGVGNPMGAF